MSVIDIADAKDWLNVVGTSQDVKVQALLDGAEQQALDYMNRRTFTEICPVCEDVCDPCSDDLDEAGDVMSEVTAEYGMPASVRTGVLILLQAVYYADPNEQEKLRANAFKLLDPYRCGLGV